MFCSKLVLSIKIFLTIVTPFSVILTLICFVAGPVYAARKGNAKIQSFSQAKRILIREVYRGHQTTFYCGSQYTQGKYVVHNNGYVPRRKSRRAPDFPNGAMVILNAWIPGANLSKIEIVLQR